MRIGFVGLVDAAPLMVARERGLFEEERVQVQLVRQLGWRAIRDGLSAGWLDLSHALLGTSAMSQVGRDGYAESVQTLMTLARGGSCIVVSSQLAALDAFTPASLSAAVRRVSQRGLLSCGHPASLSAEYFVLRDWLAQGNLKAGTDAECMSLSPSRMVEHLAKGYLDLFCAPEPWGLLAQQQGIGRIAACSVDVVPDHPEKLLVGRTAFVDQHEDEVIRTMRAVLRACQFCGEPANYPQIAAWLSSEQYLNQPAELILESLCIGPQSVGCELLAAARGGEWQFRSFSPQGCFPSATHVVWMLAQMMRWGQIPAGFDAINVARRSVQANLFRKAAASLGIQTSAQEFPDMPLKHGTFNVEQPGAIGSTSAGPKATSWRMPA
ncbi:MAG: ABC transporter substrate-binding protein [Phycisphaerales bacterium]|nr:ABC transporter substrate-binding protein [Phycisphaerales bacterium]